MLSIDIIKNFTDKFLLYKKLNEEGFPVPWTVLSNESLPLYYPSIAKPRYGSGSKNIKIIKDHIEAKSQQVNFPNSVFQELPFPKNKEITCAIYRTFKGKISSLALLRKLSNGFTICAKVLNNNEIKILCNN